MAAVSNQKIEIVRTEQGLTIAGTRITLYDVMTHLKAGWTPRLIRNWLPLTEAQLDSAISYIDANRAEVEAEYQTALEEGESVRQAWEDKNRDRLSGANFSPKPGQEEIHAKLQAWKAKLGLV